MKNLLTNTLPTLGIVKFIYFHRINAQKWYLIGALIYISLVTDELSSSRMLIDDIHFLVYIMPIHIFCAS